MTYEEQLRQQAEKRLVAGPHSAESAASQGPDLPPQDRKPLDRLLVQEHELQVHQIELQIQNEELRRANVELERSHDRYADLFEFAPVGYVTFGEDGLIEQINLTGCKQLGAVRRQVIGRRLTLFVDEPQRVLFATLLKEMFEQRPADPSHAGYSHTDFSQARSVELLAEGELLEDRYRAELRMQRQDGSTWDAQFEGVCLPGGDRPLARAVLTDVTELKQAQREVERLNESLEQRVEQRTLHARQLGEELQTFVYSITHDMTRPLRQVQGFSELLSRSLQGMDERSARHLEHLMLAAQKMNSQMSALLAFFQSSQPLNHHQKLDLNVVLDDAFRDLAAETGEREVVFTREHLPIIEADRLSLQTVFSNLLSNAVKFTRRCTSASIHVGVEERGDSYLFSVRDNGVGFDTRHSGRLFGVFQRLHSDRDFEGQGMGLALVRRIVQRYQGRIWAESVVGQGSVFWVQLPKNPAAALGQAGWE